MGATAESRRKGTGYLAIARLVWPLALGMVNNAVMQFVDRAFLARESMESLEAALPASMLALLLLGFFQGIVAYSGTFVAQHHGAKDPDGVAAAYRAGTLLALASGAVILLALPLGGLVFPSTTANPEVLSRELSYYRILTAGGVAMFGQMAAASFFTGIGQTRLVFLVNVAGNLLNVFLDALLIFGWRFVPALGIAGAAYATVAATAFQWAVLALCVRPGAGPGGRKVVKMAGGILRYGVPSGAYSVLNILSFTVFVFVTGRVGDVALAVSNAAFSVNYLLIAPMEGFALGAATLVGQAQGGGDPVRAKADGWRTLVLGLVTVAVLSLLAVVFAHPILDLFAPNDAASAREFHETGFVLFVLMAAWQLFDAADVVLSGALKGAGDTRFVMVWILVVAFGLWLPLVFAVAAFHNTIPALWATMIVYVAVLCVGTGLRWHRGAWRRHRLVSAPG